MKLRLIALGAGAVGWPPPWAPVATSQDPAVRGGAGRLGRLHGLLRRQLHLQGGAGRRAAPARSSSPSRWACRSTSARTPPRTDTVGVRSARMGTLLDDERRRGCDPTRPDEPNSVGQLTTATPGRGQLLRGARALPRAAGGGDEQAHRAQPALSVTYAWSNLRIYNTPADSGHAVRRGPEVHGERLHRGVPGEGHLAGGEVPERHHEAGRMTPCATRTRTTRWAACAARASTRSSR